MARSEIDPLAKLNPEIVAHYDALDSAQRARTKENIEDRMRRARELVVDYVSRYTSEHPRQAALDAYLQSVLLDPRLRTLLQMRMDIAESKRGGGEDSSFPCKLWSGMLDLPDLGKYEVRFYLVDAFSPRITIEVEGSFEALSYEDLGWESVKPVAQTLPAVAQIQTRLVKSELRRNSGTPFDALTQDKVEGPVQALQREGGRDWGELLEVVDISDPDSIGKIAGVGMMRAFGNCEFFPDRSVVVDGIRWSGLHWPKMEAFLVNGGGRDSDASGPEEYNLHVWYSALVAAGVTPQQLQQNLDRIISEIEAEWGRAKLKSK